MTATNGSGGFWSDAALVARKDLRIEARSKVVLSQLLPFAVLLLVLFAFGLGDMIVRGEGVKKADIGATALGAGLFWIAVLLCALLAVQRSFAIEGSDAGRDGLRLSALDPGAIYVGKAVAIAIELFALEAALAVSTTLFFGISFLTTPARAGVLVLVSVLATIGLAATGTCYGALSGGTRSRDTLLPILYFPVAAPLLLSAAAASKEALGDGLDATWPWIRLLGVFAVVYGAAGVLVFGQLLEDS